MRADREFVSLPRLVRTAAERYADREAVVEGRARTTFGGLGARVERAAAACMAHGVMPGDRVAVWAPNGCDWIVAALGAVTAGAVLVPLNTRLKGAEAVRLLGRTRTSLLFVTGPFLGASYVATLRAAAGVGAGRGAGPLPGLPQLREVVVLAGEAPAGFRSWKEFTEAGEAVPAEVVRARADAVRPGAAADITFTSGTTGEPRGAVISHDRTLRAFGTWSDLAGLREGDRYLIVNPFSHTFGYKAGVIASLMRGATMVPQPVFAPEVLPALVAAERITVLPGPPTLLRALLDHPAREAYDLSSLRVVVTGAAVVPRALVDRLRDELGVPVVLTAYGMSEATGLVTMCRPGDPAEVVVRSSGRAVPDTEVKVVAADGTALPAGEPGEILVRGYQVMSGYFEDPEATAAAVDADGWLHTGDVGVLDADGNLSVTDRLKDMFVVGGFNAFPAEIEQVLCRHPEVAEAAVVGVPDARLGEVGRAYVVLRGPGRLSAGELIAWARREMANYKVPRTVEFVAELPRNASGKVVKRLLRERQG
ncbi:3-[(3aS,4S,7aS)-7a-methyl-1,5-dioxo-octahydro-1H-inden-4-yl]propanoyl:CoA ligase [Streptomyces mashuensis]|uniref:3-[(3aS,4S,7aS)-7a-methyl-1, 5-dioxo-octahydro-1H-inden-4-yl]propanoyl:CoA ligase n=1 Tax=Streptomyces mashuensis TaxID=33904 RepID=A0A919B660_9ACTN|nr:FadD3 family acyl-CoA ligase [Streptomyces mashuensis]GHF58047.1 3-[(3aS,4S,7aS)-7a-methyl-1,5-dioxo-octahydro-1H-inden-4-yl]propanoyl:CoA ligase [Streptomyces mashuensis]